MVYTLRFFSLQNAVFHNFNLFGFCIIHILYTGCVKIKKNNSGTKRLLVSESHFALAPVHSGVHPTAVAYPGIFFGVGINKFS
jgi:hypothetical protein